MAAGWLSHFELQSEISSDPDFAAVRETAAFRDLLSEFAFSARTLRHMNMESQRRFTRVRNLGAALVLSVAFLSSSLAGSLAQTADLIITGGTIYTLDPKMPRVEAVAVSGQWIVYAGTLGEAARYRGPSTRTLDVAGMTVLPGFVDAHAHLAGLGNSLAVVDLSGTKSPQEVRDRVLARMTGAEPGAWVLGRGWDQNDWEVRVFPTWRDLEGTDSHPVALRRVDGHAVWVNRCGLEVCGVTRTTPDPAGGKIVRDDAGEPTGVLVDNAADLVRAKIPEPSFDERVARLKRAVAECQRYGLTGVHDAGVGEKDLDAIRYLDQHHELGLRVYAMLDADEPAFAEAFIRSGPAADEDQYVVVRALKLYADGALGSRGAALIEPYTDDPGNRGLLVHTREDLLRWTVLALENGFQVGTHAIGDAANRLMLDVYEEALSERPAADPRLRMEHAQVLAPEDIGRFAKLGVIAAMQPTHATSDMYWAVDRVGARRIEGAYAWRKLIEAGCTIACGSDFPVESPDPLAGIYAAVTRRDRKGYPEGGWYPEERMTIEEAIRGFTTDAAFAGFAEHVKGTIQPNMLADVTVLSMDPFVIPSTDLLSARVVYTIVGGDVVYEAPETPSAPGKGAREE